MRIWYRFRVCMPTADYPWFLIPSHASVRSCLILRKQFDGCLFARARLKIFFTLSSFSANLVVDPEKHCNERKLCLVPVNKIWNIECNGMPSWKNPFFWATSIFHFVQVETFAGSNGKQKGNLNTDACKRLLRVISRSWRWRELDERKDHKVSVSLQQTCFNEHFNKKNCVLYANSETYIMAKLHTIRSSSEWGYMLLMVNTTIKTTTKENQEAVTLVNEMELLWSLSNTYLLYVLLAYLNLTVHIVR